MLRYTILVFAVVLELNQLFAGCDPGLFSEKKTPTEMSPACY